LDAVHFDLSGKPLSYKERGFDSYSPSLAGKGLGVRFFYCTSRNREMPYLQASPLFQENPELLNF
jgi:hypothetical protein